MKNGLLLILILLGLGELTAQSYVTAVGVRAGDGIGLTVQQRVGKRATLEGVLQQKPNAGETRLTLLAERHIPIFTRHLNVYVGAGVHKGWIQRTDKPAVDPVGLSAVGGLELSIGRINLAYDFKPAFHLNNGLSAIEGNSALSLRYVLVKDKKFKQFSKNRKKKKRQKAREKRRNARG